MSPALPRCRALAATRILSVAAIGFVAASCSTAERPTQPTGHSVAISTLQRINTQAHRCWLTDAEFKSYGIVPELNTTGTPRLLVIPRGKPQALPQLVVTAAGSSPQVYGPLTASPLSGRIDKDVARWAAGSTSCTA